MERAALEDLAGARTSGKGLNGGKGVKRVGECVLDNERGWGTSFVGENKRNWKAEFEHIFDFAEARKRIRWADAQDDVAERGEENEASSSQVFARPPLGRSVSNP